MQVEQFEKALIVATAWQLARSSDTNELLALCCLIRNWVQPKFTIPGQPVHMPMRNDLYYKSYSEACEDLLSIYPIRSLPKLTEPALVDPQEGIMFQVDSVYDCTLPDVTSSASVPNGARYFNRGVDPNSWVYTHIVQFQDKHPLIGTFGSQQFYA